MLVTSDENLKGVLLSYFEHLENVALGSRIQFLFSEMISRISVTLARRQLSTTGQRQGGFSYFITRSPKQAKRAMYG